MFIPKIIAAPAVTNCSSFKDLFLVFNPNKPAMPITTAMNINGRKNLFYVILSVVVLYQLYHTWKLREKHSQL